MAQISKKFRSMRLAIALLASLYLLIIVVLALSGAPSRYVLKAPFDIVWNHILIRPRLLVGRIDGRKNAHAALTAKHTNFVTGGRLSTDVQGIYPGVPNCSIPEQITVTDIDYDVGEEASDKVRDAYASAYNSELLKGHPGTFQENCALNR